MDGDETLENESFDNNTTHATTLEESNLEESNLEESVSKNDTNDTDEKKSNEDETKLEQTIETKASDGERQPETVQADDRNSLGTPLATKQIIKTENKIDDKNISRSGRVIKRTKYLHDELEDTPPASAKRKRSSESTTTLLKIKKNDDFAGTYQFYNLFFVFCFFSYK